MCERYWIRWWTQKGRPNIPARCEKWTIICSKIVHHWESEGAREWAGWRWWEERGKEKVVNHLCLQQRENLYMHGEFQLPFPQSLCENIKCCYCSFFGLRVVGSVSYRFVSFRFILFEWLLAHMPVCTSYATIFFRLTYIFLHLLHRAYKGSYTHTCIKRITSPYKVEMLQCQRWILKTKYRAKEWL